MKLVSCGYVLDFKQWKRSFDTIGKVITPQVHNTVYDNTMIESVTLIRTVINQETVVKLPYD